MKLNLDINFLQSDFWFNILAQKGEKVFIFPKDLRIKAIEKALPMGYKYLYFPRGPILGSSPTEKTSCLDYIIDELVNKKSAANEKIGFIRIEPNNEDFLLIQERAKKENLKLQKTINLQPQKTLLLDLTKDISVLEKELSQKTRYNIRLAEKKGVRIVKGDVSNFNDFWRLMKITGERDKFGIHDEKHYQNMIAGGAENIQLWLAQYEDKVIAAGIFCFYHGQATYMHGASDNSFRNLMAPHLLQWTLIKEAKEQGCDTYDFYGIDEDKWPGVTRFKKGFGGEELELPGTYDLVFNSLYYSVYTNLRSIYRKIRRVL